ncbi:hypothetical protein BSG1_19025 [Bacillus sp. SG-1]|nr:hypothetical protein BSG1_19025 [Bacillus sp. SG-1]
MGKGDWFLEGMLRRKGCNWSKEIKFWNGCWIEKGVIRLNRKSFGKAGGSKRE